MFTPLLFAVRGGHLDATRALLDAGADVNERLADGMSALVLAVYNAHYELAAALLERGADPNAAAQGWTALHQVAWSRRPNRGFNMPAAVPTGNLDSLELVRRLVARGADVNARMTKEPRDGNRNMLNRIGATPFLMAAKTADVPLMRALLDSRRRPEAHHHRRHVGADGGGRRRRLRSGREPGHGTKRRSKRSSWRSKSAAATSTAPTRTARRRCTARSTAAARCR